MWKIIKFILKLCGIRYKTYDIFEWFPILICQQIFQHLDGRDVLTASLVSKTWNDFCAESQQMAKVKLSLHYEQIELGPYYDDIVLLKNSKRKYQNIEITGVSKADRLWILVIFESKAGFWKSVKMRDCHLLSPEGWFDLLQIIEPTIEELYIDLFHVSYGDENFNPEWKFKHLKFLEIFYWEYDTKKYFVQCTKLVKYHWDMPYKVSDEFLMEARSSLQQDVRTILTKNHDLKDVSSKNDTTLIEYCSEFRFKLEKVQISNSRHQLEAEMLFTFLQTHAPTLKTLKINEKLDKQCLKLILGGMPDLTTLSISFNGCKEAISNWHHDIPVNTKITCFGLYDEVSVEDQSSFAIFIRTLPKLKEFRCIKLTDEILVSLSEAVPALEGIFTTEETFSRRPLGVRYYSCGSYKGEFFKQRLWRQATDFNFPALVRKVMRKKHEQQRKLRSMAE